MTAETPQQINLFSGELTDTRTSAQKRRDRTTQVPQPMEMFEQLDLAQFGVRANPIMPLTVATALGLEREDHRTDEEKERDLQREAEALTIPLLTACTALIPYVPPETRVTVYEPPCRTLMAREPVGKPTPKDTCFSELPNPDEDMLLLYRATLNKLAFSLF